MRNLLHITSLLIVCLSTLSLSNATYFESSTKNNIVHADRVIVSNNIINSSNNSVRYITIEEAFIGLTEKLNARDVLNYTKIKLNFTGVIVGSPFYKSIQKLVSLGALPNKNVSLVGGRNISKYNFLKLAENTYDINLIQASQIKSLKLQKATIDDLLTLHKLLINLENNVNLKIKTPLVLSNNSNSVALAEKKKIFNDVQKTLLEEHYDKDTLNEIELIEAATIGLTKGTGDRFTTFFPPTENKSFMESLEGTFEGIGSYVEMQEPGVMKIVTPISGSPSEKAGLKGGDRVTHADGKEILKTTSIAEAISWIKGPKGTTVILTIQRGREILKFSVVRDTIIIKNVEHKKIDSSTYYIKLVSFGENVSGDFRNALTEMKKQNGTKKLIIDLRNNPGGYLSEVSDMLSYFVPYGEETVVVKYLSSEKNYYSRGYELIDFSKYRIIILQNSGSASASEIMAGTIKDYLPKTTIIGEQSYGKGSVQAIKPYSDGSSLKYTVAKWFTGKTSTGIDGVGIPVDFELEFDFDKFKNLKIDNQLEKAKTIK